MGHSPMIIDAAGMAHADSATRGAPRHIHARARIVRGCGAGFGRAQSVNEVPETALSDEPGCGSARARIAVVL
jgi:hypothetical protein